MSWFTAPKETEQPPCPSCSSSQYVVLVRVSGEFKIFDCKKCKTEKKPKEHVPHRYRKEAK